MENSKLKVEDLHTPTETRSDTDHGIALTANEIIKRAKPGHDTGYPIADEVIPMDGLVKFATDIATAKAELTRTTNIDTARAAIRAAAEVMAPEIEIERRDAVRSANTDALTGLANQAAFNKALSLAERDQDIAVISFDGDNFGTINKQRHQAAGDAAIIALADSIRQAAADFGSNRVFRGGGDEFYVLCSPNSANDIILKAGQILNHRILSGLPLTDALGEPHPADWFTDLGVSGAWAQTRNDADTQVQKIKDGKNKAASNPKPE